jgi:hypothetical protein
MPTRGRLANTLTVNKETPTRRSIPRRASKRSRDEAEDAVEIIQEESPSSKRRVSLRQKLTIRKIEQPDSDSESYNDSDEATETRIKAKLQPKKEGSTRKSTKTTAAASRKKHRNTHIADLTCPHCDRVFSIREGLSYHIVNYVCRQDERPGGPIQRGRRKKTGASSGSKPWKRIRGSLDDRTCTICARVFTSRNGLAYHLKQRVCEATVEGAAAVPMDSLTAGQQYTTCYGIVQVVRDDQATPTAVFPAKELKELKDKWLHAKQKADVHIVKQQDNWRAANLLKRRQLTLLFENGQVSRKSVSNVVAKSNDGVAVPRRSFRDDPSVPPESFPNRIVECLLVSDERKRYRSNGDVYTVGAVAAGTRLFLRRCVLESVYRSDQDLYECDDCGRYFTTMPGRKYHVQAKVCVTKNVASKQAAAKSLACLDRRVSSNEQPKEAIIILRAKPAQDGEAVEPIRRVYKRKREKKIQFVSVYPQVWNALNFRLLPKSEIPWKHGTMSAFRIKDEVVEQLEGLDTTQSEGGNLVPQTLENTPRSVTSRATSVAPPVKQTLQDPTVVVEELERQLAYEQSMLLGPVYHSVWKSLKFNDPSKLKKKKPSSVESDRVIKDDASGSNSASMLGIPPSACSQQVCPSGDNVDYSNKKRRVVVSLEHFRPPMNPRGDAPILDTRVLVAEVESGRYPSFQRNSRDVIHEDACYICKQTGGPPLMRCDFCPKVNHMACMLSRFIVKEPEPEDDFMCNFCIQYVQQRRNRAERRRVQKHGPDNRKELDAQDLELETTVVPGKEYECLAAQGRRVMDLKELLMEIKKTLAQCLETAKISRIRQSCIASCEK